MKMNTICQYKFEFKISTSQIKDVFFIMKNNNKESKTNINNVLRCDDYLWKAQFIVTPMMNQCTCFFKGKNKWNVVVMNTPVQFGFEMVTYYAYESKFEIEISNQNVSYMDPSKTSVKLMKEYNGYDKELELYEPLNKFVVINKINKLCNVGILINNIHMFTKYGIELMTHLWDDSKHTNYCWYITEINGKKSNKKLLENIQKNSHENKGYIVRLVYKEIIYVKLLYAFSKNDKRIKLFAPLNHVITYNFTNEGILVKSINKDNIYGRQLSKYISKTHKNKCYITEINGKNIIGIKMYDIESKWNDIYKNCYNSKKMKGYDLRFIIK